MIDNPQEAFIWLAVLIGAWGTLGNEGRSTGYYVIVATVVIILLLAAMTAGALL